MQAVAAEFFGCAEKLYCYLEKKSLKHVVSIHFIFKTCF